MHYNISFEMNSQIPKVVFEYSESIQIIEYLLALLRNEDLVALPRGILNRI